VLQAGRDGFIGRIVGLESCSFRIGEENQWVLPLGFILGDKKTGRKTMVGTVQP